MAARVLRRPYWLPAPAFALRLALGEMATLVLDGLYLHPARLQDAGFSFRFASLEPACAICWKRRNHPLIHANLHYFIFAWISGDVCHAVLLADPISPAVFPPGRLCAHFSAPGGWLPRSTSSPAGGLGRDVVAAVAGFNEGLGHALHAFLFSLRWEGQGLRIFIGGLVRLARQAGFVGAPDQSEVVEDDLLARREPARVDIVPFPTRQV